MLGISIGELHTKTTSAYPFTPCQNGCHQEILQQMLVRLWSVGNLYSLLVGCNQVHYGETFGDFSKKLNIDLLYNPVVSDLDIYPENFIPCHREICAPMFIASLCYITRERNRPSFPSINE